MDRRRFLVGVGSVGLTGTAGCLGSLTGGGSDGGGGVTISPTNTPAGTDTPTPEPPEFVITEAPDRTFKADGEWMIEFVVANRGEQDGTFTSTLQIRPVSGGAWEDVTDVSISVEAGETTEFSRELDPIDATGEFEFRLDGTRTVWSITFEGASSELRGGGDSRTYVDVPYRDYLDKEVEEIKSNATAYSYEELYRNADSLRGETVTFSGTIGQVLVQDPANTYLIRYSETRGFVYATYVGDRFIEGDRIECWGEVVGLEIYESGAGSENTVPSLTLADVRRIE